MIETPSDRFGHRAFHDLVQQTLDLIAGAARARCSSALRRGKPSGTGFPSRRTGEKRIFVRVPAAWKRKHAIDGNGSRLGSLVAAGSQVLVLEGRGLRRALHRPSAPPAPSSKPAIMRRAAPAVPLAEPPAKLRRYRSCRSRCSTWYHSPTARSTTGCRLRGTSSILSDIGIRVTCRLDLDVTQAGTEGNSGRLRKVAMCSGLAFLRRDLGSADGEPDG